MEREFIENQKYIQAKKRVEKIKGFYIHFAVYIIVNIVLSGIIIFGLTSDNEYNFIEAISHFGVYSTWIFWGIGLFFHWLGVFGFHSLGLGKDWEEKKIKELMESEDKRREKF
jgi:ABC-type multidrug transport system fused ATPase/permease subunit